MLFTLTTITAFLSTIAAAAPAPQTPQPTETVSITDFFVRNHGSTPDAVGFQLTGRNATDLACTATDPTLLTVYVCGESKYRFSLINGTTTDYGLRIYHELAPAFGFYGEGDVATYCRAGGDGIDDRICDQVAPVEIVIDAF